MISRQRYYSSILTAQASQALDKRLPQPHNGEGSHHSNGLRISADSPYLQPTANIWKRTMGKFGHTRMDDKTMRMGFALHFYLPPPSAYKLGSAVPQTCPYGNCGQPLDDRLHHAFKCRHNKGAVSQRHHAIARGIHTLLKRNQRYLDGDVRYEPLVNSCNYNPTNADDTTEHRADIALARGTAYDLHDVQVSHPPSDAAHARNPDLTVTAIEKSKLQHYTSKYNVPAAQVIPIALDTYGRLGPIAIKYFDVLFGEIATKQAGEDKKAIPKIVARLRATLYETISCTLATGNGRVIRGYLSLGQRRPELLQSAPQLNVP